MRPTILVLAPLLLAIAQSAAAQPAARPGHGATGRLSASGAGANGKDERAHAGPAATPVALGETVRGELAPGDEQNRGRSYSDTWSYRGREGETLIITLASDAFDTHLFFGRVNRRACMGMDGDDDGGEGTDSRLVVTLDQDGEYHVHVASMVAGARGAYALRVERGAPEPAAVHGATPRADLSRGNAVVSRLEDTDRRLEDGSLYEPWTYRGAAGERVTFHLRSRDFDAYLYVGRMVDGAWQELGHNDDAAAGTGDSALTVTLPADGEYVVRASALAAVGNGRYSVAVDRR